jgi:hypothetical protein
VGHKEGAKVGAGRAADAVVGEKGVARGTGENRPPATRTGKWASEPSERTERAAKLVKQAKQVEWGKEDGCSGGAAGGADRAGRKRKMALPAR